MYTKRNRSLDYDCMGTIGYYRTFGIAIHNIIIICTIRSNWLSSSLAIHITHVNVYNNTYSINHKCRNSRSSIILNQLRVIVRLS